MAEFDKLEILIETDASKAQAAIDNLSNSLNTLDKSLNLKNGANLLSTLRDIRGLSAGLSDAFNSIDLSGISVAATDLSNKVEKANRRIANNTKSTAEIIKNNLNLDQLVSKSFQLDITPKVSFENIRMLPALISEITTELATATTQGAGALEERLSLSVDRVNELIERVAVLRSQFQGNIGGEEQPLLTDYHDVDYREVVDDREYVSTFEEDFERIIEGYRRAAEEQSRFGNFDFSKLSDGLSSLSENVNKLGKVFGKLGGYGVRILGLGDAISKLKSGLSKVNIFTPFKGVVEEYKEKFDEIKKHFNNFVKNFKSGLAKMGAFWKRAMRTFTFMILRKAFTQIIKDIGEATQSLALFSKEMGTGFNDNVSNLIADFKWIAKAIVGAFEPIINYVVPILDKLTAALVRVITKLGEFFAALTGQNYYMVAKKKVEDYAGSLKKAAKEAKKSIRPFDELNLITSGNQKDDDNGLNPMEDWDMKPVSDKMKKFADMIKDLARKIWEPIKKAWDKTRDYVISGFKYMVDELAKLGKSIGRDFLKVWQQDATVKIFENIFKIVGDIERVIGNLAKRFREAWDEGEKGLHIFENIRDIIGILIQHVRNVTEYMVEWSDSIDFNPLLEGVETLTNSLKRLADFIGGVFEDVMKNVVLKYIKWFIEEGAPHFLETIAEIIDVFNFDKIRQDLVPFEQAFEGMLENIHTGVTNAIGFLGKTVADWMNSDKFTKFMEALAHIMEQITAERVEKVLEGIGLAILHIAESITDFVSSDKFLDTIDKIGEWIDKSSPEDIAKIVENIMKLTGAFLALSKVLPLVGKGLKAITMFKAVGNIGKIAKSLSGADGAAKGIGGLFKGAKAAKGAGDVIFPDVMTKGGFAPGVTKLQALLEKLGETATSVGGKISAAFTAVDWGAVFTGDIGANVAAGGATAGATIAASILGGITAAIGGWKIGNLIDRKLHDDEGMGSFTEQMKGIKDSFSDGSWKDALDLWGQDLSQGWKDIGEEIKSSDIGEWVGEKWQGISEKAGQLKEDVTGAFSLMGQDIATALEPITSRVGKAFEGIGIIIKAVWMTVVNWINTNVVIPVSKFFVTLSNNIKKAWTSIVSWFNATVIQPLVNTFNTCVTTIQTAFNNVWSAIQLVLTTAVSVVNTTVIQPLIAVFNLCATTIQNALTTAWTVIQGVWSAAYNWFNTYVIQPIEKTFTITINAIKGAFNALWKTIKSGAKTAINTVIGGVEKAINGMISGINNIFIKTFNAIVSKAAQITGDNWGSGIELIPKISIPRLATGGFPEDGWFRASHGEMIGQFDNGKSVVANNQQIIDGIKAGVIDGMMQILPSLAQAVSNDTTVVVEGDMNKMFRAMVKENYGANKRTFNASPLYS